MINMISRLGQSVIYNCEQAGYLTLFLLRALGRMFSWPIKLGPIIKQLHFIGAKSTFVIVTASLTIGLVLGLQLYYELNKFGAVDRLGTVVALSMIREMGPVVTALMVIGRAGSAMCAEVGIMRTDEQLDALECMAIDPYRFLMVPKFWATIISLPLLVAISDVVGILGGYVAGVWIFDVPSGAYFYGMYSSVDWVDINMGLVKSFVFGLIIVWISTGKGFLLHLDREGSYGAEGVSRITTQAVVLASISVLVADYLISAFMI
ncbi:ABC transporter permease [Pleionea sp. CnH1-48]|uniref:MlaE family ABC transporter permease n=1 Tax=Pleionea sp. CnH1-48 TaxID=2954494 RepID=UPI0020969282|nr:ABC transporter permease [Pleionea sp. CnH1-48]MCO7226690.1 MlaE family lipid ABC transporter permease subunit [Pleionea sp. CnH1-48]